MSGSDNGLWSDNSTCSNVSDGAYDEGSNALSHGRHR